MIIFLQLHRDYSSIFEWLSKLFILIYVWKIHTKIHLHISNERKNVNQYHSFLQQKYDKWQDIRHEIFKSHHRNNE